MARRKVKNGDIFSARLVFPLPPPSAPGSPRMRLIERMAREAMDICLRVLKESSKRRFDSYSARNSELIVSPYYLSGLSRAHFFRQPFSK